MEGIVKLDKQKILFATDIRGNLEDYLTIVSKFKELKGQGKADVLVLGGNLIHSCGSEYGDKSLQILDDLIDNKSGVSGDVITLLGNHELMHIYHMDMVNGGQHFVESLEDEMGANRERYVGFMKSMPYAIRTAGGVLINNAGASYTVAGFEQDVDLEARKMMFINPDNSSNYGLMNTFNHDLLLDELEKTTRDRMEKESGVKLVDNFFDDFSPQIDETLAEDHRGTFLWDAYFNENEHEFGNENYQAILNAFLDAPTETGANQNFLVSGNIKEPEGYNIIAERQLRMCSSYGAKKENKTLLLIDSAKEYEFIDELVMGVMNLYN